MPKNQSKKKILVTGASGLLGLELVRYLGSRDHDVVGTYNSSPKLVDKNYRNFKCNVGNAGSVASLSEKIGKLDTIFHCASMTGVDKCEKNRKECWQANVLGTRNVVKLAKDNKAQLVFISTGSVFSGETGGYKENDTPDPKNFYSWTKLLGEEAVLAYNQGIVARVVPIGIHSIGRPQANFIEWLVDSIRNNRSLNLFNDVNINAISAKTLAGLLLKVPRVLSKGVLHIGSKDRLSKAEIGQVIIGKFPDFSGEAKLTSVDNMPGNFAARPKEMWLNIDKATKLSLKMPKLKDELELILEAITKK